MVNHLKVLRKEAIEALKRNNRHLTTIIEGPDTKLMNVTKEFLQQIVDTNLATINLWEVEGKRIEA